jgi:hypothetical protein
MASKVGIRVWIRFMECDTCVSFRKRRAVGTTSEEELDELRAQEAEHYRFFRAERMGYYTRRELAIARPTDQMSVIIDAADQSRFNLPHFKSTSHKTAGGPKINLHLVGALNHGRGVSAYTVLPHVRQGTNVTIDVLHRVLCDTYATEGTLPEVLFLQLDNTSKQCKSKYMMAWLGVLVMWGLFREVLVSFLPVGHTHEDIDQFFSRSSVALLKQDALSRLQLAEVVRGSYTTSRGKKPTVEHLDTLANISGLLDPLICALPGISDYYQAKVTAVTGADQRRGPVIQFKKWSTDAVETYGIDYHGLAQMTATTQLFKDTPEAHAFLSATPSAALKGVPTHQRHHHVKYETELAGKVKGHDAERELKDHTKMAASIPALLRRVCKLADGDPDLVDMERCLAAMSPATDSTPFQWNTEMYDEVAADFKTRVAGEEGAVAPLADAVFDKGNVVFVRSDVASEPHYLAKIEHDGVHLEATTGEMRRALTVRYYTCDTPGVYAAGKRCYSHQLGAVDANPVFLSCVGGAQQVRDSVFNKTKKNGKFVLAPATLGYLNWLNDVKKTHDEQEKQKARTPKTNRNKRRKK